MAINPITLQMTVPMTNDMALVQNQENMRATTEHMQFANANEKKTQEERETVIKKDPTEFPEYRYDAKEKGNNSYYSSGKKKKRQEKKEEEDSSEQAVKEKEKKKHVVQIDIKL